MKLVFFVHSVVSDWNHGNAHFLRGLMRSLQRMGHTVESWEPRGAWALDNLVAEHGIAPVVEWARAFPTLGVNTYDEAADDLPAVLDAVVADADVVLVHEWNTPRLVNAVADARERSEFVLLFHDTHHRPWSDPDAIARFELARYDGVLAFGDVLRDVYRDRFGVERCWTFHEAADTELFRPLERDRTDDVVWVGNWGDGERTEELRRFWLDNAHALPGLRWAAHGVRYPDAALAELAAAGVEFRGWIASHRVPEVFARSAATLHVPRRTYVENLPGIPTIRVFEALACGIPLISAPWQDSEGLFRPGDYVRADTPAEMRAAIEHLVADADAHAEQAARGLETVLARHTCDHRAAELLAVVDQLGSAGSAVAHRSGGAKWS